MQIIEVPQKFDIGKTLAREHSREQTFKIVKFVGKDAARFSNLVDIYLKGPYRITQRAAWPLTYCAENHPELVKPHLKRLLDFLRVPGIHDAVKRNTMRMLQFIEIPKKYHGQTADLCFQYLLEKEPVAIKVFAMTVLSTIVKTQPELSKELRIIIEDQLPYESAAFRARAAKVLKSLVAIDPTNKA